MSESVALGAGPAERLGEILAANGAERLPAGVDGITGVRVDKERLLDLLEALRDEPGLGFKLLLDVTAVDWYGHEPRFEVVYHLYSIEAKRRVRVKTRCSELDARVPSAMPLFPTADYHEREVYDFFGIVFDGHPDLRRIFMPDDYGWFPLRKDFPLAGVEPEKSYLNHGGVLMPRPPGAEPIEGAGSETP